MSDSYIYPYNLNYILKIIAAVNVLMVVLISCLYFWGDNLAYLAHWVIVLVGLTFSLRYLVRQDLLGRLVFSVSLFSFFMLSLVGFISVMSYSHAYGLAFAPYDDDSYYFINIADIAYGHLPNSYTLYELLMAPFFYLFKSINQEVSALSLLPVNWALGGAIVGLATYLSAKLSGRISLLAPIVLLVNFHFVDATVHLYRDGLALFLTLLCVIYATQKQYLVAVIFALLTGLTRGGNGMFCFIYIFIYLLYDLGWLRQFNKKAIIACLLILVLFVMIDYTAKFSVYGRAFIIGTDVTERTTIVDRAIMRGEKLVGDSSADGFDTLSTLYKSGPLGMVAMPFANMFGPARWTGFRQDIDVKVRTGDIIGTQSVQRPVLAFMLVTILLWPLIGPSLVQGLVCSVRNDKFYFLVIFLVTLIGISLISFQSRHRTAFIIFFPCLVALASWQSSKDFKRRLWLMLFFIGLIFTANIIPFII